MTDKYGSDHEHDLADHEHGDIEHPEAEAWHGDHPPVDDFADHAGEEVASVSEEAESAEDLEASEVVAEKKPTSLLPIIAGVGLLLILGAGLYWQFGISKSGSTTNQYAQTPPPLAIPPVPAAIPNTNANVSQTTASTVNAAPVSDIAPTTSYAPPSQPAASAAVANGVAIPQPVPVASAAPIAAPTPPVSAAATPVATPNLPPVISQPPSTAAASNNGGTGNASPAIDGRLNTLSNRVEDLQKSLDQATLKLTQVSGMLANQMATSPSNAGIEERLNKIEQQMMHIQHNSATISPSILVQAPAPAATADTPSTEANGNSQAASSTSEHPVHKPHATGTTTAAKSKPAPQHTTSSASRPVTMASAPQPLAMPHDMWVLRAATPNEAWVAKNASTSDLHHIQVGDTLAGIGQIRAIHQSGEGWVIEGSQGTIR